MKDKKKLIDSIDCALALKETEKATVDSWKGLKKSQEEASQKSKEIRKAMIIPKDNGYPKN